VEHLPVRKKKKTNRVRCFHFIVFRYRGRRFLLHRDQQDIWTGLYAPPVIEAATDQRPAITRIRSLAQQLFGHHDLELTTSSDVVEQLLSHQTIRGRFHEVTLLVAPVQKTVDAIWVNSKNIHDYGKPKLVTDWF
jgi:A/G-specific adenine glycosylase